MAEASRDRLAAVTKGTIVTEIFPFTKFYLAEDYHQKHMLRNRSSILKEFEAHYPVIEDFITSTAVTKVNGYLGGYGACDMLKAEIDQLGLSEKGRKRLLDEVCVGNTGASCRNGSCQ